MHQNVRIHNPFCGVPESPRDVVFLVKQYIGSEVLTQAPEICFPFAGLEYLPQEEFPLSPGKVLPREPLSRRQCQEFLKTAQLVSEPPWVLHRAARYLRALVSDNEAGSSPRWAAPAIHWVFEEPAPAQELQVAEHDIFDFAFAVTEPLPVHITGGDLSKPAGPPKPNSRRLLRKTTEPSSSNRRILRKTTEPGASPDVRGAPPGSAVLAQGQPRGSTVPKEPLSVRKRPASLDPMGLHTAKECTSPSALEDAAADVPPSATVVAAICPANSRARKGGKFVHIPDGCLVGCSRCRFSPNGCRACRVKAGLRESVSEPGRWLPPPTDNEA